MIGESSLRRWLAPLALQLLVTMLGTFLCFGADPEPTESVLYRRVFVPEADLSTEIRGLLPIKREEFDRLIAIAAQPSSDAGAATTARLTQVDYTARLEGDQLVEGELLAEVTLSSTEPTILSLGETSLALGAGEWLGGASKPAIVGTDRSGKAMLLVQQSGTWQQKFTARGQREATVLTIPLTLPPSSRSRLHLDLPTDVELSCDVGIVSRDVTSADKQVGGPQEEASKTSANPSTRRWIVQLGGHQQASLVITPLASVGQLSSLVLLRESASYFLSPGAIDTEFQLEFDVHSRPLTELSIKLPPTVEPVAIRWGEQQLTWTTFTADDETKTLRVPLPTPLSGMGRVIQVSTVSPTPLASKFDLPRIAVEHATWQEGRATVTASRALRLRATPRQGCWQSAVASSSSPRWGESLQFQYHKSDAAVEVELESPQLRLGITSGTIVSIDGTQMSGVFTADLTALAGDRFELTAILARRWIVDAVESTPANLFEDRVLTPTGPNLQQLRMRLVRPLREGNTVRIVIRAHQRRLAPDQQVPIDWLRMVEFPTIVESREWLAIKSSDPSLVPQWIGDASITRLDLQRATPAELSLFESSPGPNGVLLDRLSNNLKLDVRRADPRFSAESNITTKLDRRGIEHVLAVKVMPETTAISKLLIRLAPAPEEEPTWRLVGAAARSSTITQTLLSPPPGDSPQREQLWQLEFSTPQGGTFELEATTRQSPSRLVSVPLLSLPQATQQQGTVSVAALDATEFQLIADRLTPLPQSYAANVVEASRHFYQYDPGRNATLVLQIASAKKEGSAAKSTENLEKLPETAEAPRAIAWSMVVHSRYPWSGDALHEASLHLENWGLDRLPIRLPPQALLQEIEIDGRRAPLPIVRPTDSELTIALPRDNRLSKVVVRYQAPAEPTNWLYERKLELVSPMLAIPVAHREWLVTPPGGMLPINESALRVLPLDSSSQTVAQRAPGDRIELETGKLAPATFWGWPRLPRWLSSGSPPRAKSASFRAAGPVAPGAIDPPQTAGDPEPVYRVNLASAGETTLIVYDPTRATTLGLAAALCSMGLVVWLLRERLLTALTSALALLLLSIIVPNSLLPLVAGVSAGILAGILVAGLFPTRVVVARLHDDRTGSTTRLLPYAGALLLLAALAGQLRSQESAPMPLAQQQPIAKVVIAVDAENKPVGDYVFVPPNFYETLLRREASVTTSQTPWLIRDAQYDLQLSPSVTDEVVRAEMLAVTYTITTQKQAEKVAIPLKRAELRLVEGRAQLDGFPASAVWSEDGNSLLLDIPAAGDHKLKLAFALETRVEPQQSRVTVSIPKVAHAALRISSPVALQRLEIPSALGASETSLDEPLTYAALGATSLLDVSWTSLATDELQSVVEADQLLWCRIRPSSVIVQGKFIVRPLRGSIREVAITAPSNYVLLPGSNNPLIARSWKTEGEPATFHFELRERTASEVKIDASFLLAGGTGVGNVAIPKVNVLADRIARSWVTLATGSELEIAPLTDEKGKLDPLVFVEAWGPTTLSETPAVALDLSTNTASSVVVAPAIEQSRCEQWIDFSVARATCKIQFQASLQGLSSHHFEHRIRLPASVVVKRLVVREDNKLAPCRWAQSKDGTVDVLLLQPPATLQNIELEASIPAPQQGKLELAEFLVEGAECAGSRVRLYRLPDVQLSLGKLVGYVAEPNPAVGEDWPLLGRLVAEVRRIPLEQMNQRRELELVIAPNEPAAHGKLITTIEPSDDGWQAKLSADFTSTSGSIDIFRVLLPSQLEAPSEITPAVDHQLVTTMGESQRQLVVKPPKPVDSQFAFSLTAKLAPAMGGILRVPMPMLLDLTEVDSLVVLPQRVGSQTLNWQTSGLQSLPRDAAVTLVPDLAASSEVFRVVSSSPSAELAITAPSSSNPTLFLADYQLIIDSTGSVSGNSVFLLDSAGKSTIPLELPPRSTLLSVTIDGCLVIPQVISSGQVLVPLPITGVPQVIEVNWLYKTSLASTTSQETLELPQLAAIAAARTCCTLRSSDDVSLVNLPSSHQVVSGFRIDTDRLSAFVDSRLSLRSSKSIDMSSQAISQWLQSSQAEALTVYNDLQARASRSSPDELVMYQALGNKIRFTTSSQLQPGDTIDVPQWLIPKRTSEARVPEVSHVQGCTGEGALRSVAVARTEPRDSRPASHRSLALAALGAIILASVSILLISPLRHWIVTHLGFVCVLTGLAVWPLLPDAWTSILLWLILAVISGMQLPRRWMVTSTQQVR
ncbi:hypothetical protein Psta_4067 [Pirellula staleyi DSM 6068]|uniref:Uncharacterized protein n=1 Tax=Pirellula staleyi (strain ATCC 27377 / DSM 6068 / ICPB 4128) TaxID=530564 RepID=D2R2Y7_PIRSD|nr:hypothetical protein [Pirellula staleyi]ADB18720.1 hypothetical protein Psta_4067 [Pirellula staleyi DSM 6068]